MKNFLSKILSLPNGGANAGMHTSDVAPYIVDGKPAFDVVGETIRDQLAPAYVQVANDYLNIGGIYARMLYIASWPSTVSRIFWKRLLLFPKDIIVSMHFSPISPDIANEAMSREISAAAATSLLEQMRKGYSDSVSNVRMSKIEAERVRTALEGDPIFMLTTVIGVMAPDKEKLDESTNEVLQILRDAGVKDVYTAAFEQLQAFDTAMPIGLNQMGQHRRNVNPSTITQLMPMISEEIVAPKGFYFGQDVYNNSTVILDPYEMQNPHMVIIGSTGAGKSYFMKDLIEQAVLSNVFVVVTDIEGEYYHLTRDLGGVYLDMSLGSDTKINILEITPDDPEGLAGAFEDFAVWYSAILNETLPAEAKSILEEAYRTAFSSCGIYFNMPETLTRKPPRLYNIYEEINKISKNISRTSFIRNWASKLAAALDPYVKGSKANSYDCDSNISIQDAPLVVFGLKDVSKDDKLPRIKQIQSWTWTRFLADKRRKMEIADEAWFLLENPITANDLAERFRRLRKKNCAMVVATQNVGEFAANRSAAVVLSLAATHIYFRQGAATIDALAKIGRLNETEQQTLLSLDSGRFLLHSGSIKRLVQKTVPPERHKLYTTKPNESLPDRT